ncbi:hypothetical protein JNUCC1_01518 [Lentibacillus sp. JNUCC-1]|uniref:hypothetical protein n=1 Tax=Lentibacillus sp. JNUCC-1 TaxID=2654513 RepID=UPI0012E8C29E|nr:hypothetical protein [Lentibacillus sp. JNUCC-1]MUV37712.1 hypothetical protein [Lentibacillus sp. JNUCC-1]
MKRVLFFTFFVGLFILSGCSIGFSGSQDDAKQEAEGEKQSSVEWADIVKWNDKLYHFDEEMSSSFMKKKLIRNWEKLILL